MQRRSRALEAVAGTLLLWSGIRATILWGNYERPLTKPSRVAQYIAVQKKTVLVNISRHNPKRTNEPLSRRPAFTAPVIHSSVAKIMDGAPRTSVIPFMPLPTKIPFAATPEGLDSFASRDHARKDQGLTISAWLYWRQDTGITPSVSNGQLGGSQAGMRARLALTNLGKKGNIGITGRISSPLLQREGKEVALGTSFKLNRPLSIEIIAERRIALDQGGRNAFAILAASGIYDAPLGSGLSANGYAQAGVIGIKSRDYFADGAISVDHKVIEKEAYAVALGLGLWGTVQPKKGRLDAGPQIIIVPKKLGIPIRVSAQWRMRVVGDARPTSGPTLTLSSDF